jgi:hypothetical protein
MLYPLRMLALTLPLVAFSASLRAQDEGREAEFAVTVDSARHEVVIRVGPFVLPSMAAHAAHGHEMEMPQFSYGFVWPVDGTGRGFRMSIRDAEGKRISQRVLHHLSIINRERRQLLLPLDERIMSAGRETPTVLLPPTVGLPLARGNRMKLGIMWHNETPDDVDAAWLTIQIRYSPANLMPRPVLTLPIAMDVADMPGQPNTFTVPPGRSEVAREFIMPVSAHLLGANGHMHDWGTELRLEDAASGKVMTRIKPRLDSLGKIQQMPTRLYGIVGDGISLRAGRRYRIVVVYDNPTGVSLRGVMGHLDGLISVSGKDFARWPKLGSPEMAYVDEGALRAEYQPPH